MPIGGFDLNRILVLLLLTCSFAHAGGRGGHNTTFDPNLFGGAANVSCLTTSVAGTCSTGYNATCNGVADDSTPLKNWLAASLAANPARAVLYIPPGSRCHFASVNNFVVDTSIAGSGGFQYGDGIRNAVIWGYGASSDAWAVIGEGFGQNNLTTARIQTVSAGATSVTLSVGGDASKFAIGKWIAITGIQLQNGGYPQNFQFFEYKLITNIVGSVITLNSPLTYSYKSTWPVYDAGSASTTDYGGPGTIYLMGPSWNTNVQVYGLGFNPTTGGAELPSSGRNISFYDIAFAQSIPSSSAAGPAPSMSEATWFFNTSWSTLSSSSGMEIDKQVSFLGLINSNGRIFTQSAANDNLLISGFRGSISGTAKNTTILNAVLPAVTEGNSLTIGPNCYGQGSTLAIDGTSIASGSSVNCFVLKTALSYSTGTFSIANGSVFANTLTWGVPGGRYFFGFAFGSTTCNAGVSFTITDITQDVTNTNYITDLVGALPNPTCDAGSGSQVYDRYVAYPAATITQKNSTGTNMTQFAAPP